MLLLLELSTAAWLPFVTKTRQKAELRTQLAAISVARARGDAVQPLQFAEALRSCVAEGSGGAVLYRLWEEALLGGLRPREHLDEKLLSDLRGLVPPEASEDADELPTDDSSALLADELPALWIRPTGSVQEFYCTEPEGIAAAWDAVAANAAPVLFRGVGHEWAALRTWKLAALRRWLRRGMVRVSPGPAVTFCRESHPRVRSGEFTPPSRILSMRGAEFVQRLRRGRGGLHPLVYGSDERVYLQASLPA